MKTISLALLLVFCLSFTAPSARAQSEAPAASRKVITRVMPAYPRIARDLNLTGAVRLEVMVNASGTVKTIQVKGGSPLLVQSAQDAIHNWKWEKAEHETSELTEFNFKP
jgi:TonB family protein